MFGPTMQSDQEGHKLVAALLRAIPVTRMVDYGVPVGEALKIHAATSALEATWDEACERLAMRHAEMATLADRNGHALTARQAWRTASALFQCAQLAFNADSKRKVDLYESSRSALDHHARLSRDLQFTRRSTPAGDLYSWLVKPRGTRPKAAVVVIGGLSGWSSAYLDMGRALAARGMLAILAEGPGQGLTRMRGGMHLSSHTLPAFREFLTQAQEHSIANLGIWGNSFGGLFAALTATSDPRVQAVCINGAPMNQLVPPFRTAREQMDAVFGTAHETELHRQLVALSLGEHDRTDAAMLVLEGGQDPLVPAGSQAAFLALAASGRSELRSWVDGEHTLYNYAQERNAQVADWFSGQLGCEPAGGVLT